MDELIKQAIEALQESTCNEIELTDVTGIKVRVVRNSPVIWYRYPLPYSTWQIPIPIQQW